MYYLQSNFTTLQTVWNHRNKVVHEGIIPNPLQVILTAQSLSCKYEESLTRQSNSNMHSRRLAAEAQSAAGPWQLIIKIAGYKNKKMKRSAYVYEAINSQGVGLFFGVSSNLARTATGVLLLHHWIHLQHPQAPLWYVHRRVYECNRWNYLSH